MSKPSSPNNQKRDERQSKPTSINIVKEKLVWISFVFLAVAAVGLFAVIAYADILAKHDLFNIFYFFTLCALGLCVALILFGVLHSHAQVRGRPVGLTIKAGGPAAMWIIVVLFGWVFAPSSETFTATVYVHGQNGKSDVPLRNEGKVFLDLGGKRDPVAIGENGQAVFTEVPGKFRNQPINVGLLHIKWELSPANQAPVLKPEGAVYVSIAPMIRHLEGRVVNEDGQPVADAEVNFGKHSTKTNTQGWFSLELQADMDKEGVMLITAPGYQAHRGIAVPGSSEISVMLKRSP